MAKNDTDYVPVARFLGALGGVHASTIARWITRGVMTRNGRRVKLAALRVGGRWMARRSDVESFITQVTAAHLTPEDKPKQTGTSRAELPKK